MWDSPSNPTTPWFIGKMKWPATGHNLQSHSSGSDLWPSNSAAPEEGGCTILIMQAFWRLEGGAAQHLLGVGLNLTWCTSFFSLKFFSKFYARRMVSAEVDLAAGWIATALIKSDGQSVMILMGELYTTNQIESNYIHWKRTSKNLHRSCGKKFGVCG